MLDYGAAMMEFLRMKAILFLMAVLVAISGKIVIADDFNDYIASTYNGSGDFIRVGSTYIGNHDIVTRAGNSYVSSGGIATRAGNTYISESNEIVVKAGFVFVSDNDIMVKAGSTYNGQNGTTIDVSSYMDKPY